MKYIDMKISFFELFERIMGKNKLDKKNGTQYTFILSHVEYKK